MSQEFLTMVNGSNEPLDSALAQSVRKLAMAMASLDAKGDLRKSSIISTTYNGIASGFSVTYSDESAVSLFNTNVLSKADSLVFGGYLGYDGLVHDTLTGFVTELGGDTNPNFESLLSAVNALFCSASVNRLSQWQTKQLLTATFSYYASVYPEQASQLNATGFRDGVISRILSQPYNLVLSGIALNSPKDDEVDVYHYPFYDTTGLFSQTVDYQIMGDSETQYYYVSGGIIYDNMPSLDNPCIKQAVTGEDNTVFYVYTNLPCTDDGNSVYPVNNISFYRKFPDAPNVIGSEDLSEVFAGFNVSAAPELYDQRTGLWSDPARQYLLGRINVDLPVYESINTIETGQVPQAPNPTGYSLSHIGGNSPRWRITGYTNDMPPQPLYDFVPMTGFKIIPLSLDKNVWGADYAKLRTNPDVILDKLLIRSLSLVDYLDTGTVGGPAVNSTSFELPCLYVSEQLYNKTMSGFQSGDFFFGTFQNGGSFDSALRPVINGMKYTGVGNSGASYDIGATGNKPKISFMWTVPNTGLTGANAAYAKKCLGMGDGGGGILSTESGATGYNASHPYQSFIAKSGESVISMGDFFRELLPNVIGANQGPTLRFIDGYTSVLPASTTNLWGYSESGDLISFHYFPAWDGGVLSGWETPFPQSGLLTPIIVEQDRENYLPRYSTGPFSSEAVTFLYPSASGVNEDYPTGFPLEVMVNLTVSEQIARVFHKSSVISRVYVGGVPVLSDKFDLVDNDVFDSYGNFSEAMLWATENNPNTGFLEALPPPNSAYVDNYWSDASAVWEHFYAGGGVSAMYSGQCSQPGKTGILVTKALGLNGVVSLGTYPSGFYVFEYVTGCYQATDNPSTPFQIQSADPQSGYFLTYSDGAEMQKLPLDSTFHSTVPVYSNQHLSIFHTGGAMFISGNFPSTYSNPSRVAPVTIRLEKDCDSCLQVFQVISPNQVSGGGCKYLGESQNFACCPIVKTYPSGMLQAYSARGNSVPSFVKGLREISLERVAACGGQCFAFHFARHRYSADGPDYYSIMPDLDRDLPFHGQQSQNVNVTLKYTLPATSLRDMNLHPEYADNALQTFFCGSSGSPISALAGCSNPIYNRSGELIQDGYDLIWLERVAGNLGVDGQYHSQGLYGDAWFGMTGGYGLDTSDCDCVKRNPSADQSLIELNLRPGFEVALHTRAMNLTPGFYAVEPQDGQNWFYNFDLTGIERAHRIGGASSSISEAIKAFVTTGFSEYAYESPDYIWPAPGDDYATICSGMDSRGNATTKGVKYYWQQKVLENGVPITGFRFRDKARLNFKINSIKFNKYGSQPIDYEQNIQLTGQCRISGEFGYDSQAESAVFSEGIFLKDVSKNAPLASFYAPSFASDVLLRLPLVESGSPTSPIQPAPSKCVTRVNVPHISNRGNIYAPHLTQGPFYYNRYVVPAMSDLSVLNEGNDFAGFEQVLANDGTIFPNSVFLLSASISQHTGTPYEPFMRIPNAPKIYYLEDMRQFYDSSVTDAILNSGWFVTTGRGPKVTLNQSDASGFMGPLNASYNLWQLGIYDVAEYTGYSS
jgi:hypothetical protein